MDLGPVIVGRVQYVGSGDSDMVVDAGYCDVVRVVLAGRYGIGLGYGQCADYLNDQIAVLVLVVRAVSEVAVLRVEG